MFAVICQKIKIFDSLLCICTNYMIKDTYICIHMQMYIIFLLNQDKCHVLSQFGAVKRYLNYKPDVTIQFIYT